MTHPHAIAAGSALSLLVTFADVHHNVRFPKSVMIALG